VCPRDKLRRNELLRHLWYCIEGSWHQVVIVIRGYVYIHISFNEAVMSLIHAHIYVSVITFVCNYRVNLFYDQRCMFFFIWNERGSMWIIAEYLLLFSS
jgi:hypothetical protein